MLIAHLSDLHIAEPGTLLNTWIDTTEVLRRAVDHLNAFSPPIDLVVVTGDLVNDGTPGEYAILREELRRLAMPVRTVPGNHDRPDLHEAAFGPRQWVDDRFPVRIVGLDTTVADHHNGALTGAALEWLASVLAEAPDRPTVVSLHHPPLRTGMWWMDYGGPAGSGGLRDVVRGAPHVKAILAGHLHRRLVVAWGPTLVTVAPSLSYESGLGLGPDAEPLIHRAPARIPLWWWDGADLVLYDTDPAPPAGPAIDLRSIITDWEAYEHGARITGTMPRHGA